MHRHVSSRDGLGTAIPTARSTQERQARTERGHRARRTRARGARDHGVRRRRIDRGVGVAEYTSAPRGRWRCSPSECRSVRRPRRWRLRVRHAMPRTHFACSRRRSAVTRRAEVVAVLAVGSLARGPSAERALHRLPRRTSLRARRRPSTDVCAIPARASVGEVRAHAVVRVGGGRHAIVATEPERAERGLRRRWRASAAVAGASRRAARRIGHRIDPEWHAALPRVVLTPTEVVAHGGDRVAARSIDRQSAARARGGLRRGASARLGELRGRASGASRGGESEQGERRESTRGRHHGSVARASRFVRRALVHVAGPASTAVSRASSQMRSCTRKPAPCAWTWARCSASPSTPITPGRAVPVPARSSAVLTPSRVRPRGGMPHTPGSTIPTMRAASPARSRARSRGTTPSGSSSPKAASGA